MCRTICIKYHSQLTSLSFFSVCLLWMFDSDGTSASIFAQTSLGAPLCAPFAPRRARNPDLALRMPVWRQRLRGYLSNPAAMLRSRGRMRAWEKKDE